MINESALVEPEGEDGEILLLPAQTRYEQRGGSTETSTERRIIYSPEIPGPRPGEARSEWEIFQDLAARVKPVEHDRRRACERVESVRAGTQRALPIRRGGSVARNG